MNNKKDTLGWFCKEHGTTLKEVVEESTVQKGTLESRWGLGKKKEILCIIEGCKVLKGDEFREFYGIKCYV